MTPTQLYQKLIQRGNNPAIIWYDQTERIELSGKVTANHIAKIANFLTYDLNITPTDTVYIHLPNHWKTTLWTLATLICGCQLRIVADLNSVDLLPDDVIVTNQPEQIFIHFPHIRTVAVNLHALSFAWNSELPPEIYDGIAEIIGQADTLLVTTETTDPNWQNTFICNKSSNSAVSTLALMTTQLELQTAIHLSLTILANAQTLLLINNANLPLPRILETEKGKLYPVKAVSQE